MKILQFFLRHFCAGALALVLISLPFMFALVQLAGSPDHAKSVINTSGVYGAFVPAVFSESIRANHDPQAVTLLKDQAVKQAAEAAFTPTVLRSNAETFIDSFYRWLDGSDKELNFTVDLTQPRTQFLTNLTAYATKRAQSLPQCTTAQLQELRGSLDILTVPCLPPGIDVEAVAQKYSTDTLNNADFLRDPVLTAADLPKDASGKNFTQRPETNFPAAYQAVTASPWVGLVLAALLGLATVVLFATRQDGLRRVGWILIATSVLVLLEAFLYTAIANKTSSDINIANPEIRAVVVRLMQTIFHDMGRWMAIFGLGYAALGIALVITMRRPPAEPSETASDIASVVDTPVPATPVSNAETAAPAETTAEETGEPARRKKQAK